MNFADFWVLFEGNEGDFGVKLSWGKNLNFWGGFRGNRSFWRLLGIFLDFFCDLREFWVEKLGFFCRFVGILGQFLQNLGTFWAFPGILGR